MELKIGLIDDRIIYVLKHHPKASDLPDGAEFGWNYNLEALVGQIEKPLCFLNNDELTSFSYFR